MKILNNVTTPKQLESTNQVLAPIVTASDVKVTDLHADILDSFHADAGVVANTIPVRGSDTKIPGSITGDANTVDGKHASDFATAGHTHTYIKFADTRAVASSPVDYSAELEANLKQNAIIGLAESGTYAKVLGISGWQDDTGGLTHELAFGDSSNIFYRSGSRAAGWNAWQKIWHTGNDGHNSGLDSDTLDTLHASDFARAVHTHVSTDVIEDTTHRFITDDERARWELAVGGAGEIYKDGTYIGMRRRLNFVSGNNITLSAIENNVTGQIDITMAETFTYSHPATHPASMITGLATVATSGSYLDLSNKPSSSVANIDDAVTKRHTQNTDTGTTSVTFQVDSDGSGPKLKNVGGALEIRNAADSGYADIVVNNVTIMGTTTTINSETLAIADNQVLLNSNYAGSAPTESAGVAVNRGTLTQASLIWDESSDLWKAGLLGSETALSLVGHTHVSTNITDFHEAVEDVIATTITDSTTINFTYDDTAGTIVGAVNDNTSIQKINMGVSGAIAGTRKTLNLIPGSNMSVTAADDAANDRVNVTVAMPGSVTDVGVNFTMAASSTSKGITWSGVTDYYSIFAEEYGGAESTRLVIKAMDNEQDYVVFRHQLSGGTTIDQFTVARSAVTSLINFDALAGIDLTGAMTINDTNTQILEGALNSVRIQTNSGFIDIGAQNTSYAHFATDRGKFHFNAPIYVTGEIYAGAAYDKQVWHSGNFTPATKVNKAGDAMTGMLEVSNLTAANWTENLRLPKANNGWTTIAMGCAPGSVGTGAGVWSLHTDPSANFLICHAGSTSDKGLLMKADKTLNWFNSPIWTDDLAVWDRLRGKPVGLKGQTYFIDADSTSTIRAGYLLEKGRFVDTAGELATAKTETISFQTVFDSWYRFSHFTSDTYPYSAAETTSWSYNSTTDTVSCTVNSTTHIGFVSDKQYDKYTHHVKLTAPSDGGDNDAIGVVIAFTKDSNGYEHTLTALRVRSVESHTQVTGGPAFQWAIVYNYQKTSAKVIATAAVTGDSVGGWAASGGTIVEISRDGDSIVASTSAFGSTTLDAASKLTVALTSDPVLEKFRGPQAYGYSCMSQPGSTFSEIAFSATGNAIYDLLNNQVWSYNTTTSAWEVNAAESLIGDYGSGRLLYNTLTRKLFYIEHDQSVSRVDVASDYVAPHNHDDAYLRKTGGSLIGDIILSKNNAWITIDSSSAGGNGVEQGAGLSIGESGYKGAACLHMTYTGDGYGHIGMGAVDGTSGLPAYEAMTMFYTDNIVRFHNTPQVNGNNIWHAGNLTPVAQTSANRPGVTRLYRRDDDSNYSVQINWDGTKWILKGYYGDAVHADCWVNYANIATSATRSSIVTCPDGDRNPSTKLPITTPGGVRFDFSQASLCGTGGNYAGVMTYSPWDGTTASTGDASYQLAFGSTAANGGGLPMLNIRKGIDSTWGSWCNILVTSPTGNTDGYFDKTAVAPTGTARLNYSGYLYATRLYGAVYNDYAEYFEKGEDTLEPGDIVIMNPEDEDNYIKSRFEYDELVVGVYSDDYAQCIGGKGDGNDEEGYASVGMAGRARVKVTGKVKKGDKIVASNIPGVGMAASEYRPGTVVGKALESHDGDGIDRIKILIVNM